MPAMINAHNDKTGSAKEVNQPNLQAPESAYHNMQNVDYNTDTQHDQDRQIFNNEPRKSYTLDLTPRNTLLGTLRNKRELILLIDSGATTSLVSQSFLEENASTIDKLDYIDDPIKICIADGTSMLADKMITCSIR